ncbi:hypothetical protein OG618_37275 (plasmid) [Kitasatospora sp. NBC_01246]|uniref:hypothetical protein n=1 Tax=Kitasatospora sp. NBC_01246 TaxID=2903570 RepID=UPI002E3510DA|nr:hypothetical protein [Kitasatospora sp. NBC_01246]
MTTPTPTPAHRTDAITAEITRLSHQAAVLRHIDPAERTDADRTRFAEITARLRALVAVPPPGYALPKAAADLIAYADARKWVADVHWFVTAGADPFVKVRVGRALSGAEAAGRRGNAWTYALCWHARGCAPGRVRLFGPILATTPDNPAMHNVPTVAAVIRAISDSR